MELLLYILIHIGFKIEKESPGEAAGEARARVSLQER